MMRKKKNKKMKKLRKLLKSKSISLFGRKEEL